MPCAMLRYARRLLVSWRPGRVTPPASARRCLQSLAAQKPTDVLRTLASSDVVTLHGRLGGLIQESVERHDALTSMAATSSLSGDLVREMRAVEPIAQNERRIVDLQNEIIDVRALATEAGQGSELAVLAGEEEQDLQLKLSEFAIELVAALLDKCDDQSSPATTRGEGIWSKQSTIVEVRAGAGGDEASLFVTDLLNMYDRYAARKRWRSRVLSLSETAVGGVREVIMRFEGNGVYDRLRLEAGVHRVQRVPKTESAGRVHTSTATVAVLKDDAAVQKTIKLNDSDVRMDVYRASGAGGQHVNKTESAVRLTHIPTGLVAQSQEDRSQHRNRAIAMESLISRVAAKQAADAAAVKTAERHDQLGVSQGERSDRIRTYNFPQRRVTDHRIVMDSTIKELLPSAAKDPAEKNADLDGVLDGSEELDRVMDAVFRQSMLDRLTMLVEISEATARKAGAATSAAR